MSIELDINKPVVPLAVCYGNISGQIADMCRQMQIPIPDELKNFVRKNNDEEAFDWEHKILVAGEDMDITLLKQWIDKIPGHFFRAELRAIYKRRIANDTQKQA